MGHNGKSVRIGVINCTQIVYKSKKLYFVVIEVRSRRSLSITTITDHFTLLGTWLLFYFVAKGT